MSAEPVHDIDALLRDLEDEDPAVRTLAAKVFGRLIEPPPRVIAALITRLEDEQPMVRSMAAASLGRLGPVAQDAVPTLGALLDDPLAPVRFWAADALARIGATAALREPLERLAADEDPLAKSARAAARRALAGLEPPSSNDR